MLWRRRRAAEPPPPRCSVPGCPRPAILDDGPNTPCWACLFRFGDAANRPDVLSDGEVVMLLEAHGDVVELIAAPVMRGHRKVGIVQRWAWRQPAATGADVT